MKSYYYLLGALILGASLSSLAMEQAMGPGTGEYIIFFDQQDDKSFSNNSGSYELSKEQANEFFANHKKTFMALGSGTLAIGSNIIFGGTNAPLVTIFLGTFGTSIKGILPKSSDKQFVKIGLAFLIGAGAIGADIGLKYLGFNTYWALSNCALVGGIAALKRIQKGHIKEDTKKEKKILRTTT